MSSLFIIGNGFDLAHGLPTRYKDFYNYLLKTYPDAEGLDPSFGIQTIQMPDGSEEFNTDELVAFLINTISEVSGEDWNDFESSLGRLNFDNDLYVMETLFEDENDDSSLFRMAYRNEDATANFYKASLKIKDLFSEWINTIDVSDVEPKDSFDSLINSLEDTFLTFNYTPVLEEVYEAYDVYPIHGQQNNEIIIGHGEDDKEIINSFVGSEYSLAQIHSALRKNTKEIIERAQEEFYELLSGDIEKVYSYGFSFSDVDLPYISEICKRLDTENITWYLNDFKYEETGELFKNKIKECGFKGEFSVFSIKENSPLEKTKSK
ncbi:bacteriophage abortive infection AbiH family protein [Bacillus vallismortis]|uniref:Bacteriophage abortive infection AbiH family protein n=1 Tax=Bacillus vallismortis TaxID=72361 RepID=A0AAP3FZB2_BACVA|nr:bacteriophage abortive infection AbiH family protein [Bacillus vallismortis]MCY8318784.1 bacteriophage abortive infection AbiH family protein [Bacillus vallismortis]